MNTAKLTYPPLAKDDILTLKGLPVAKKIVIGKNLSTTEEWVYYNMKARIKEYYIFQNERFINYRKNNVI